VRADGSARRAIRAGIALAVTLASTTVAVAQDAHPAVRYSCMSDPPAGQAWPWVAAGVPYAIERMHPGYGIESYTGFTIEGLRLFVIVGGPRAPGLSERYAEVEAADASDAPVIGRALFLRSIVGVSDPSSLALRAMVISMRRADERALQQAPRDINETQRAQIAPPSVVGRTLTFWIRARADQPWAREITVDLDTGAVTGDPG